MDNLYNRDICNLIGLTFVILLNCMGNQPPKPQKKVSVQDSIIEMKIQSKAIMRASKKAQKQCQKYKKQAKEALKKNNEDFAKLYLTSASQKHTQSLNYQRTSIKMQLMCQQIKSLQNNEKMINTFNYMTGIVSQQMGQLDTAKMAEQMQLFNEKMDQVLINTKMTQELMQGNQVVDNNVDHMMDALKQEIAVEDKGKIIEGGQKQEYNINTNTNTNMNLQKQGAMKQEQGGDPFLDQLKGL